MDEKKVKSFVEFFKIMPLEEKEHFFWDCFGILQDEKLLFDSFKADDFKKRFDIILSEDEYGYLKENFTTYGEMMGDFVDYLIDDLLIERKREESEE